MSQKHHTLAGYYQWHSLADIPLPFCCHDDVTPPNNAGRMGETEATGCVTFTNVQEDTVPAEYGVKVECTLSFLDCHL
jgi:hypothetical protein